MLKVHSIETFGTHEGPGIRTVIFLQGCNFRCLYCHNPDTQKVICNTSTECKVMGQDELIKIILNNQPYYGEKGGVTISGGEPLLQTDLLIKLFSEFRKLRINKALDTNGSILNEQVKKLLGLTDLVILDVKHIDDKIHRNLTGCGNKTVLEFAGYLEEIKKPFWLRYVLVPGFTDQEEFLEQWAKYFSGFQSVKRIEILPYHTLGVYKYEELGRTYKLKNVNPPTEDQTATAKKIFEKYLRNVYIR